jgi:hypothetical protein
VSSPCCGLYCIVSHTHNLATTFSETFHQPVAIDNGNQ